MMRAREKQKRRILGLAALLGLVVLGTAGGAWAADGKPDRPYPPYAIDSWLGKVGRPIVIGIAGDSGSGKTTVAMDLQKMLGKDRVVVMSTDDWHSMDRTQRGAAKVTALNPVATDFRRMASDLAALRRGETITKNIYDHSNGQIYKNAEKVKPAPIIIVEGLHPLGTKDVRAQLDLSIYVDPRPSVKYAWKEQRDVGQRGYSREAVLKEIRARVPDYNAYIRPQRDAADMHLQYGFSKVKGAPAGALQVQVRERGLGPADARTRVSAGGDGFVLRSERRRDGTGVTTLDGNIPKRTLDQIGRGLARVGVKAQLEEGSPTLSGMRLLVANRIVQTIQSVAVATRGGGSLETGRGLSTSTSVVAGLRGQAVPRFPRDRTIATATATAGAAGRLVSPSTATARGSAGATPVAFYSAARQGGGIMPYSAARSGFGFGGGAVAGGAGPGAGARRGR